MKKTPRLRKVKSVSNAGPDSTRTEALLAQLLLHIMGDAGQKKKVLALRAAGFSNGAIGDLMGTSADVVATVLYQARRVRAESTKVKRPKKRPARRAVGRGRG